MTQNIFTLKLVKLYFLVVILSNCKTTLAFSFSWFGSPSYREVPQPYGAPPIDYGECDWYDATMSAYPQPLSPMNSGGATTGLGYDDYDAGVPLRGGHRSPSQLAPYGNSDPYSSVSSFGDFMSAPDEGEPYNADDLTAAHRTLPIGSYVTVINENNERSVAVRIVDNRGPNVVGRVMTLSRAAFHQIADLDERTVPCYVSVK